MATRVLSLVFVVLWCPALNAQYVWQQKFPSLPTFSYPTDLVFSNDGTNRVFVVQQYGVIYVFQNEDSVTTRKTFLDISDRLLQTDVQTGLLGMTFHPRFPDSAYVYLNYVRDSSSTYRTYISRFTVSSTNPDSALHDSERVILTVDEPTDVHHGGQLAFGPDGYLYIGLGDGGPEYDPNNAGQDRTTMHGKILRIDVDHPANGLNYSIPPTNPYYQNSLGYREEIYAYGVRNPWKFSFDAVTGTLWLGDVGQDTREEIDTVVSGGNYGWRLMEGFICTPILNPTCEDTAGLLLPVWDYPHDGSSKAVTGGFVYRGATIPSLVGKYVFGDYITGETWALTNSSTGSDTVLPLAQEPLLIPTFGQDANGELYFASYSATAAIYRLLDTTTVLSVDVTGFTVKGNGLQTMLHWRTSAETDVFGFGIERQDAASPVNWQQVGFVMASGSPNVPRDYTFTDQCPQPGRYVYRIKQLNRNGTFSRTETLAVDVGLPPTTLTLEQNYPNPFNPSSTIEFSVPTTEHAILKVYDVLGREVATLFDGKAVEGTNYHILFNTPELATGTYIVRLVAGGVMRERKMILLK